MAADLRRGLYTNFSDTTLGAPFNLLDSVDLRFQMDWFKLLESFQSLISAVAGGVLVLASNLIMENRRQSHEKRKSKEREYLEVIDDVHNLREALRNMMSNAQAQAELKRLETRNIEKEQQLDQEGVAVIEELFGVVRKLEVNGDHLQVFGTKKVIEAHRKLMSSLWTYLTDVGESASASGKVSYEAYSKEIDELRVQLEELISAIRVDLGYGKLSQCDYSL